MAYQRGNDRFGGDNRHGGDDRWRDREGGNRWSRERASHGGHFDRGPRDRSRDDDDHRSLLERIEAKLSRLFGDDDDARGGSSMRGGYGVGGRFESRTGWGDERTGYAAPESDGRDDDRVPGGPHVDAPGWDPSLAGPRFDRVDVGSTGTHGAHPVSSFYGAGYGIGAMGDTAGSGNYARERMLRERGGGGSSSGFGGDIHDRNYSDWRRRQVEQLDRDYDDYRREHQSRFEQEFGGWREKRQGQRSSLGRVTEHMEVVGSDGQHIGVVDHVKRDRIILTKNDESAGGRHHSIPCGWIENVDDKVTINKSADEAMRAWKDEENNRALFENEDQGSEGPHVLNRSFSGTY